MKDFAKVMHSNSGFCCADYGSTGHCDCGGVHFSGAAGAAADSDGRVTVFVVKSGRAGGRFFL